MLIRAKFKLMMLYIHLPFAPFMCVDYWLLRGNPKLQTKQNEITKFSHVYVSSGRMLQNCL